MILSKNQKLKVAPGPQTETLVNEMLNFKVKIDPATAHDSYSAWIEAEHDVALAVWYGENGPRKYDIVGCEPVVGGRFPLELM